MSELRVTSKAKIASTAGIVSLVGTGIGLLVAFTGNQTPSLNLKEATISYNMQFRNEFTKNISSKIITGKLTINNDQYEYMYDTVSSSEISTTYLIDNTIYSTYNNNMTCIGKFESNDWASVLNTTYTDFEKIDPIENDDWYKCSGQLYTQNIFNIDFLLCYANKPLFIAGSNFKLNINDITPKYEKITIKEPIDNQYCIDNEKSNRRQLRENSPLITPSINPLEVHPVSERFWETSHKRKLSIVAKNPHICFIHGMGETLGGNGRSNDNTVREYSINDFPDTWKGSDKVFPYELGFISHYWSINTVENTWQTQSLLEQTLNWIISTGCNQIYAHSMGNVIMVALNHRIGVDLTISAANKLILKQRFPSMNANYDNFYIRWNDLAGPIKGSWVTNDVKKYCEGSSYDPRLWVGTKLGYCTVKNNKNIAVPAINSLVPKQDCKLGPCNYWTAGCEESLYGNYEYSDTTVCDKSWYGTYYAPLCCTSGPILYPDIPDNKRATIPMAKLLTGKLCGTSTMGNSDIGSSLGLTAIAKILTNYGDITGNDGMVAFSACADDDEIKQMNTKFGTRAATSAWYMAKVNHADSGGWSQDPVSADGVSEDRKPNKWIRFRIIANDAIMANQALQLNPYN